MSTLGQVNDTADLFGIVPADDLVHLPPGVPGWSENLQLVVNDGRAGIAFYMHLSRMVEDPGVWEGILICYLPDGGLRVSRSFARLGGTTAACDGQLTFRPVEPLRRWRLEFDGMARILTREEGAAGPVTQGPVELLQLTLEVNGTTPPWGVGSQQTGGDAAEAIDRKSVV